MNKQDYIQSRYYQEDFLASHSVLPGSGEARRMTVTSGLKCLELYRKSGPLGSLVRMLLGSSAWSSPSRNLEWRADTLAASQTRTIMRRYYHDKKICCSSHSLTTLSVSDTKSNHLLFRLVPLEPRTGGIDARLWPTPIATDWKNRGGKEYRQGREIQLQTVVGGQLNPTWVEWLMGFPLGWTELKASETP